MTLLELADRCEAATGPDRRLMYEIGNAIFPPNDGIGFDSENSFRWHYEDFLLNEAFLDAAMVLVDPRALWAHGCMEDGPFARLCWPQPGGSYTGGYFVATAATVPLAICAAALRARAAA